LYQYWGAHCAATTPQLEAANFLLGAAMTYGLS